MKTQNNLVDGPRAAAELGISNDLLRSYRKRRLGPAFVQMSGTKVMYARPDLERWREARALGLSLEDATALCARGPQDAAVERIKQRVADLARLQQAVA
jgi:DNA-binding transcriptional MerR regulator